MSAPFNWKVDGRDWPHRNASHFLSAGDVDWHVQIMGSGPPLLLLHGTGASTHSWRDVAPILAQHFRVIAPDLPGHAFSGNHWSRQLSLPGMAESIAALLRALDVEPQIVVGHSAGAAVALRLTLDRAAHPKLVIGLNSALLPFPGWAGQLFPTVARLLFLNPFASMLLARRARNLEAVRRVIIGTGSYLSPDGLRYYVRLFENSRHLDATLGMMANWDLAPLFSDLKRLKAPLLLVTGAADKAVPANNAQEAAKQAPHAEIVALPKLGHLAHEEAPQEVARLILERALAALAKQSA
jgi:magnesium chelatase accessory protein